MAQPSGWNIDIKSLSDEELSKVLSLLKGSEHKETQAKIRRELINRVRAVGMSDYDIINHYLLFGVGRAVERREIAEDWANALGLTVSGFLRVASGK